MPSTPQKPAAIDSTRVSSPTASETLSTLIESGNFSDFKIQCGERTWNVHKSIICARSGYFKKCCSGPFKEATENEIDLGTEDADVLSKMIGFLYTSDYKGNLNMHTAMYAIAVKFEVPGLQALAKTRFEESLLSARPKHVHLVDLIPAVYDSTEAGDQGLRGPLVRYVGDNIHKFLATKHFQEAHEDNPDFAFALLHYHAQNGLVPTSEHLRRCRVCVAAKSKIAAGEARPSYGQLINVHADDSNDFKQILNSAKVPTVAFLNHLKKIMDITTG